MKIDTKVRFKPIPNEEWSDSKNFDTIQKDRTQRPKALNESNQDLL